MIRSRAAARGERSYALIATALSAAFLFAIAAANIVVLAQICGALRGRGKHGRMPADNLDQGLNNGLLARLFSPLFALIRRSWHAYPLGLLFGLGFDTATEVGLLGLSAVSVAGSSRREWAAL